MHPDFVPGIGPLGAKVALVGEAPGDTESRKKEPFVGRAGKLLTSLLNSAGLLRQSIYITNVVKERPPSNNISLYITAGTKNVRTTELYDLYEEYLYRELDECKANVIVAAGNVALYALTRKWGIKRYRGSVLEAVPRLGGRKVVPILHPAACLRPDQSVGKQMIAQDLAGKVRKEMEFPDIRYPERALHVRPSFDDAMDYLASIKPGSTVAFDIEYLRKGTMTCFSFAKTPWDAISVPIWNGNHHAYYPDQESLIILELARILEDPNIGIVIQNAMFDCTVMHHDYGIVSRAVEDTLTAHKILFPDLPAGLDFMCSVYTDEPYYKDDIKEYNEGGMGSLERFWEYNAKDSAVTLEIWHVLSGLLESRHNWLTYKNQMALLEPLMFMQARGIKVDVDAMRQESESIGPELVRLEEEINKAVGYEINPRSTKQLKAYFYEDLGERPLVRDGRPTVDDDALRRLSKRGIAVADLVRQYRKLAKLKGTYLEMVFDDDNRMRCSYTLAVSTLRISSKQSLFSIYIPDRGERKNTGGNMQNIDPRMKKYLVADEDYLIFDVDLGQAENRIVAYCGPVPEMMEAFEHGVDVHRLTFSKAFHVPLELVSDEDGSCNFGDGSKSQRFWGKTMNHALNYDMGSGEFALKYDVHVREANTIIAAYHRAYPGVRLNYQGMIKRQLYGGRVTTNPYGRRRRFMGDLDKSMFKTAYADFPQSTVGYKINQEGIIMMYNNQQTFHGVELISQVHDSIVFQVPVALGFDYIAQVLRALKTSLETPVPWSTPFVIPADCKVGLSLYKKHMIELERYTPEELEATYDRLLATR